MVGDASGQCLTVPELKKICRILSEEAIKKGYKGTDVFLKRIKTKIEEIICIKETEKGFKDLNFKPSLSIGDYIELGVVLREILNKFKLKFLKYYRLKSIVRKIESILNSIFKEFDYIITAGE